MGAGSNRMNIYTVGMATQGFANYLKINFKDMKQIASLFAMTAVTILSLC